MGGIVSFIGAGPGDPELITVKGRRLLSEADVVIYAGSLVPAAMLECVRPEAERHDSAGMVLEEIIEVMRRSVAEGKRVVRLASGDPAIFGTLAEQLERLEALQIPYEIIPGVSSVFAAAAALGIELTVPDLVQTVILTRVEGRTKMPEGEDLAALASHRSTMVLFLSAQAIGKVARELAKTYPPETPVAVVQKASLPDQKIVTGTLADIAAMVKAAGIVWTAVIIVGPAVDRAVSAAGHRSRLYSADFAHGFRPALPSPTPSPRSGRGDE